MRIVVKELLYAVKTLFTTTKDRVVLLGLVLIAAIISVSELAVAKLFTDIIDFEKTMSKTNLIILIIGFFLFFGITKAGHFLQRVYKVRFFEKAFKESRDIYLYLGFENKELAKKLSNSIVESTATNGSRIYIARDFSYKISNSPDADFYRENNKTTK